VRARQEEVEQWRAAGRISLPSSLGIEKATNPFLRCDETSVHEIISVRQKNADLTPALVFEALRAWKDHF
jgi:hydroxyacylglutathione hydrolase